MITFDRYIDFFNSIYEEVQHPNEITMKITKELGTIVKDLYVEKVMLEFFAPRTPIDPMGKHVQGWLYDSGYEGDCKKFEKKIVSKENFDFYIRYFYIDDSFLADDNMRMIEFITDQLYALFGRARMTILLDNGTFVDNNCGVFNSDGLHFFYNKNIRQNNACSYVGIFLNFKGFKYVNQLVGNRVGDEIIRAVACSLRDHLEYDECIARLGGDNFYIFVKKERCEQFIDFAKDVQLDLDKSITDKVPSIKSCMGVISIEEPVDSGQLVTLASIALEQAKKLSNTDVVYYEQKMSRDMFRQKQYLAAFDKAIEDKEFVVYYQPKVNSRTGKMCGCEALVRWVHESKMIPPSDFIELFEGDGKICKLDFYVFERTCENLRNWLDEGIEPVRVSINFSRMHLRNECFAEQLFAIMKKYNIDSKYIEVEITETCDYEDFDILKTFVDRLKIGGVCISIDDFGTGYSSLNMLKNLNVDVVKLDKLLVDNIEGAEQADKIILKHVVSMINDLDMSAIAEGVEKKTQEEFLNNINCTIIQGYLYSKPIPVEEFEKWLKNKA